MFCLLSVAALFSMALALVCWCLTGLMRDVGPPCSESFHTSEDAAPRPNSQYVVNKNDDG